MSFPVTRLRRLREEFERERQKAVPREDRVGFAKDLMGRRLATPKIVVVHGRQVIVDKGVGMDEFKGCSLRKDMFSLTSACFV